MNLIKKLVFTSICCFPVGVAVAGYELNSIEEISDLKEVRISDDSSVDIEEKSQISHEVIAEEEAVASSGVENNEGKEDTELNSSQDAKTETEESKPLQTSTLASSDNQVEKLNTSSEKNVVSIEKQDSGESQKLSQSSVVPDAEVTASSKESELEKPSKQTESFAQQDIEHVKIDRVSNQEDLSKKQQIKTTVENSPAPEVSKVISENYTTEVTKTSDIPNVSNLTPVSPKVTPKATPNYSKQELEMYKLIGRGPVTRAKLKVGLFKLRQKGKLTFNDRKTYVFLNQLLEKTKQ